MSKKDPDRPCDAKVITVEFPGGVHNIKQQMPENFKDYPTQMKDGSNYAEDWTPREMLINLLSEMDKGHRNLTGAIVLYREETGIGYTMSTKNRDDIISLCEIVKHIIIKDKYDGE